MKRGREEGGKEERKGKQTGGPMTSEMIFHIFGQFCVGGADNAPSGRHFLCPKESGRNGGALRSAAPVVGRFERWKKVR